MCFIRGSVNFKNIIFFLFSELCCLFELSYEFRDSMKNTIVHQKLQQFFSSWQEEFSSVAPYQRDNFHDFSFYFIKKEFEFKEEENLELFPLNSQNKQTIYHKMKCEFR
jgi:hypothetical protein